MSHWQTLVYGPMRIGAELLSTVLLALHVERVYVVG